MRQYHKKQSVSIENLRDRLEEIEQLIAVADRADAAWRARVRDEIAAIEKELMTLPRWLEFIDAADDSGSQSFLYFLDQSIRKMAINLNVPIDDILGRDAIDLFSFVLDDAEPSIDVAKPIDVKGAILAIKSENPAISSTEIAQRIKDRFSVTIDPRAIRRIWKPLKKNDKPAREPKPSPREPESKYRFGHAVYDDFFVDLDEDLETPSYGTNLIRDRLAKSRSAGNPPRDI